MRLFSIVGSALLVASCTSQASVQVQMVSDMAPGREIDVAVVTVDDGRTVSSALSSGASLGRPVRVASFDGVTPGDHRVTVTLRSEGREVMTRAKTQRVGGVTIVYLRMMRDCAGVVCPGSGSPTAIACLGGGCVEAGCDEEHPELCPPPECTVAADCAAMGSTVACAPFDCVAPGVCATLPRDDLCGGDQLCDTRLGCISAGADAGPVPDDAQAPDDAALADDAASIDAGADAAMPVDGGRDAGSDTGTDVGTDAAAPACPPGRHLVESTCVPFFDVNGDGYADLVVGAPTENSLQGQAFLYLGGPAGLSEAGRFDNGLAGERVGAAVAAVGDTNGDGRDDFLISGHGAGPGHAYAFLGRSAYPGGPLAYDTVLTADTAEFSLYMTAVGDMNGDRRGDAVLGRDSMPAAYLFAGRPGTGLPAAHDAMIRPANLTELFGGDLDGDGAGDFMAMGPLTTNERLLVFLARAGAYPMGTPDAILTCPDGPGSNFGPSAILDVTGDGVPDVVVGASAASAVYVFPGRAGTTPSPIATRLMAPAGHAGYGHAVAALGSVDGDAHGDVAIVSDLEGAAAVMFAHGTPTGLDRVTTTFLLPSTAGGRARVRLGAADFDGDGVVDLAVGDTARNSVYVIRGPLIGPTTLTATWTLAPGAGGFGWALAAR